MMYANNGQEYQQGFPQGPTNNNLWFGNNYSSGNSQASRSMMGNPMQMNPNGMMQGMNGMNPMQRMPQQMPQQIQAPQTMNNIIQVMGPESAVNYATGPNSHILMSDINRPVIYDKKSDDSGYSETKAFALTEIPLFEESNQIQPTQVVVTNDAEVNALKAEVEQLKQDIVELKKLIED